jgi:TolA-binding protein
MTGSPAMGQAVSLDEAEIGESESADAAQAHVQETVQPVSVSHVTPQPWPSERPMLDDVTSEIDLSLDAGVDDAPAHPQPTTAPVLPQATKKFSPGTLDEFVADLEASLGNDFIPEPPAPSPTTTPAKIAASVPDHAPKPVAAVSAPRVAAHSEPVARAAAASVSPAEHSSPPRQTSAPPQRFDPASSVDLSRMFGELKQELEHDAATAEEDPETHYNLGVAFREMGLLDEAIGELQKVCQFVDRGHTFPNIMQAYTWLAQCFLEKGLPEVAVRWYEKALKLPGLDQETRTALHYELASSLESAGNNSAALSNFLEVYSSNIDYRDVGERIKALRT